MTYLKKAETDPSLLQKKIPIIINSAGDSIQNFKPSVSFAPNQEYTIQELLEKMIIESDNDAYNTLSQNLSNELLTMTLYEKEGFLTPNKCDEIISKSNPLFETAKTLGVEIDGYRTAQNAWISNDDPLSIEIKQLSTHINY